MNKIVKGAIAGAAGIALLLGGAGTFALWNSSTTVAAGSISSGQLSITKVSDGSWFNTTTGAETAIADVSTYKIVPGNSLRWKGKLTVLAVGNDLKATLTSPTATAITNGITGSTVTLAATSADATVTKVGTTNNFTVIPASGTTNSTVDVVLDVVFPSASTGGQNKSIDLSTLQFTLQQIAIPSNVNP